MSTTPGVTVHVDLRLPVEQAGPFVTSLAVAASHDVDESLRAHGPDGPVRPEPVALPHGTRLHRVEAPEGDLHLTYDATVRLPPGEPPEVTEADRYTYLLPSRYCPSDLVGGFAAAELAGGTEAETARRIMAWIHERTAYTPGSTGPTDDALTLLHTASGVCRDFAHLGVTLCRALGMPARYVSVYAPGLNPMDAHAVVEVVVDGTWRVFDPTRLAPRGSMVRIGTGRDAADVALSTPLGAVLGPPEFEVTATASPELPNDDPDALVSLP